MNVRAAASPTQFALELLLPRHDSNELAQLFGRDFENIAERDKTLQLSIPADHPDR